ncbi:hypothetical protein D3C80_1726880 [compost metagenome]
MILCLVLVIRQQLRYQRTLGECALGRLVDQDVGAAHTAKGHVVVPWQNREDFVILVQIIVLLVAAEIAVHIARHGIQRDVAERVIDVDVFFIVGAVVQLIQHVQQNIIVRFL